MSIKYIKRENMRKKYVSYGRNALKTGLCREKICLNPRFEMENMLKRHVLSMFYMVGMHWKPVCVGKNMFKRARVERKDVQKACSNHVLYGPNALKPGAGG